MASVKWYKRILTGILLLSLFLTGCTDDSLEPWEEDAIQFLRYSHMKFDSERLQHYITNPEKAETYNTFDGWLNPGTIKVNSRPTGQRSYEVIIYFPEYPEQIKHGDYVALSIWERGKHWKVSHDKFRNSRTTDFDQFKEKFREKGMEIEKWKSYELN